MTATVIIPARYASTRFPAKVLASETGRPLVQHVVDQARKCRKVREVLVAADDPRIVAALRPFETNVVITSQSHQSGTDRIAQLARNLSDDIIVNIQADEPEIEPQTIDALIEMLQAGKDDMATVATPFPAGDDPNDPNLVKVVIDLAGHAIYFSRCAIPFRREATSAPHLPYHLHLGIYAYRREFLLEFASWEPAPLELCERLEQLRALEHGRSIAVLRTNRATHAIDTQQQYAKFVQRWKQQS